MSETSRDREGAVRVVCPCKRKPLPYGRGSCRGLTLLKHALIGAARRAPHDTTAPSRCINAASPASQSIPSRVTHTYALRIRIPNGDILPGTLAEVRLPLRERRNVTVVPVSAIVRDEGEAYVFRVRADETLERVQVSLGIRQGQQVVIEEGLAPGTRIVARDVAALASGQKVQTVSPPQPEPAAG